MSNWKKSVKKLTTWKNTIVDEAGKKAEKEKEIEARQIDKKELRNVLRAALVDAKDGVDGEKGDKGDKGDRGAKGERGQDGRDGKDGLNGEKGERGEQGLKGDKGDKGDKGFDGTNGKNGENGLNGKDGSQWLLFKEQVNESVGSEGDLALVLSTSNYYRRESNGQQLIWKWKGSLKGRDGERGERGFNGSQGPKGDAGSGGGGGGGDGLSAYEVAVANGFVGTEVEWLASLVGADGADGTNGADGADGLSAYQVAVANGFVGSQAAWLASLVGATGAAGTNGTNGTNGVDGTDGVDGVDGATREWLYGTGAPDDGGGNDGDRYLQDNGNVWAKAGGTWTYTGINIKGATGAAGTNGTNGTDGADAVTNCGNAEIDFGAFGDNNSQAKVVITGQVGILSTSKLFAQIRCVDSPDHSAEEHMIENLVIVPAEIIDDVGFSIYAFKKALGLDSDTFSYGKWNVSWFWVN
jgi:hypothetical protein